ncbi:hypothetical protein GPECTOR_1g405 [Gonium pectorale]|uniref:Serine-threonine/tyrosine-protein kinase catalytic domain-containing protein n=1 Tax=Gonium pectorale TaxID=33097 RepID=A0A150H366_GONPE|nr:hypothetical protein GPECTOR_1g405 [Gonium pectorale]|eukprot:KXZ56453.1 hypothetical protein GPECTOR_1g405 [Gonium pectorale]
MEDVESVQATNTEDPFGDDVRDKSTETAEHSASTVLLDDGPYPVSAAVSTSSSSVRLGARSPFSTYGLPSGSTSGNLGQGQFPPPFRVAADRGSASAAAAATADLSLLRPCSLAELSSQLEGLRWLASGSSGRVYTGLWKGSPVAVKVVLSATPDQLRDSVREALLSRVVSHPAICQEHLQSTTPALRTAGGSGMLQREGAAATAAAAAAAAAASGVGRTSAAVSGSTSPQDHLASPASSVNGCASAAGVSQSGGPLAAASGASARGLPMLRVVLGGGGGGSGRAGRPMSDAVTRTSGTSSRAGGSGGEALSRAAVCGSPGGSQHGAAPAAFERTSLPAGEAHSGRGSGRMPGGGGAAVSASVTTDASEAARFALASSDHQRGATPPAFGRTSVPAAPAAAMAVAKAQSFGSEPLQLPTIVARAAAACQEGPGAVSGLAATSSSAADGDGAGQPATPPAMRPWPGSLPHSRHGSASYASSGGSGGGTPPLVHGPPSQAGSPPPVSPSAAATQGRPWQQRSNGLVPSPGMWTAAAAAGGGSPPGCDGDDKSGSWASMLPAVGSEIRRAPSGAGAEFNTTLSLSELLSSEGGAGGVCGHWGAVSYLAPEVLHSGPSKKSDVYSYGALLYHMCTGKQPFQGMRQARLLATLATGNLALEWPDQVYQVLRKLGQACCSPRPAERPSFDKLVTALQRTVQHVAGSPGGGPRAESGGVAVVAPASARLRGQIHDSSRRRSVAMPSSADGSTAAATGGVGAGAGATSGAETEEERAAAAAAWRSALAGCAQLGSVPLYTALPQPSLSSER